MPLNFRETRGENEKHMSDETKTEETTTETAEKTAAKCLIGDCVLPSKTRGLCAYHYGMARKAIKAGTVTDADLVARGLIAPPLKPGRPAGLSNPFAR